MNRRLLLLLAVIIGCRRGPAVGSGAQLDASAAGPASDGASGSGPVVLSSRCHASQRDVRFDEGEGPDGLEIGDGLVRGDGYAVGLVRATSVGPVAAVALLGAAADHARLVDLGPTLGDAPPPRLVSCRNHLLAGAFATPRPSGHGAPSDARRSLALYTVDSEVAQPAVSIPQQGDDSLAFDLACSGPASIVVWDETAAAPLGIAARGVIRAASFGAGQLPADAHDVSPPDSDAEMPRAVPNGAAFFVLWIAHRPESPSPRRGRETEASADIESAGEVRAFGWLEMVPVDATGAVIGPMRRLTSTSGHVSAFDVQSRVSGPAPLILVVARDDGEAVDGSGGALVRMRVRNDEAEVPLELPTDGLGRGAPTFVVGQEPWLAWVGAREELRLLPLDEMGDAVALPSAEEGLGEARPLLLLGAGRQLPGADEDGSPKAQGEILVAAPREPREKGARLRIFSCSR